MTLKKVFIVFILLIPMTLLSYGSGRADLKAHHAPNGEGFRNSHIERGGGRFLDFLKWRFGYGPKETPAILPEEIPPFNPLDFKATPDLARINAPDPQKIQVTWIGHATLLIQTKGVNILTDPIFSERGSPFRFIGNRRISEPGIAFEKLPKIHFVLISHNHYDHLDFDTVTRFGKETRFFVPLGLAKWFKKNGIENVTELDWWESAEAGPLKLHSTPVQHFSSRSLFDFNETLWCSWIIDAPAGKTFFAGDTGYSERIFKKIRERYGPMRLTILPIGAYRPRWFMRPMHIDPPEAIKIHNDLSSERSIAMHWGTFSLTDEPPGEPPLYLKKALREAGLSEDRFIIMKFGETRRF